MTGLLLFVFLLFLAESGQAQDSDGDGWPDTLDNCILVANGPLAGSCDQFDADRDGYGNACDTDTNNDGATGLDDLAMLLGALGTLDSRFEFNCDGGIGLDDLALQLKNLGTSPGPSYLSCAGTVPCVDGPLPLFVVEKPSLEQGALPAGSTGETTFFVRIRTVNASNYTMGLSVDSVSLEDEEGTILASFSPQGASPDEVGQAGIYSVSFSYDGSALDAGDCEDFRVGLDTLSGRFESDLISFCATEQPRGLAVWSPEVVQDVSGNPIAGGDGFMVYLEDSASESDLESLATALDADVVGSKLDFGFYQLRLREPETSLTDLNSTLATIQANASVAAASRDLLVTPHAGFGAYEAPEFSGALDFNHLARIRADEAWFLSHGAGITIAVIDTGAEPLSPDLDGRLLEGQSFVPGNDNPDDESTDGHGTRVASMAAASFNSDGFGGVGVAPEAYVLPVKIFDDPDNETSTTTVSFITRLVEAIQWVSRQDVDIVVMSLGPTDPTQIDPLEWSPVCRAIAAAPSRILFVASAGNENFQINAVGSGYPPASCAGVLVVGGTMSNASGNEVRWFESASVGSNYGSRIDISAPAKDLAYPDATRGGQITATSYSAPLVAGAAAVLMSFNPQLDATEVKERLKESSEAMPGISGMGEGFLDVFEALTNGGFERDGSRNLSWDESGSWNQRDFLGSDTWFTPLTYFIADETRYLASMETEFGDIEPSSGDWMAVIPNGTTEYSGTPGFDGSSSTVYETGFLGIEFVIRDLGEGGQLPISFDWALVAALDPGDIPCSGIPGSDCLSYTSGEPLYLLGGSGPSALFFESFGEGQINLFPETSTTATLPLSPHPSTWSGWQNFSDSYSANPGQFTQLLFVNSPVGYRIKPNPDSDLASPDWVSEQTNFSLLIDNLEFRSQD